jgi:hypothetical protein
MELALERDEFRFLRDPVARGEMASYEAKVSAITGRASYHAADGGHDDTVVARLLLLKAALTSGPVVDARAAAVFGASQ